MATSPSDPPAELVAGLLAGTLGPGARVFHTVFVVADLDHARADLGAALGVTFTEPAEGRLACETPAGSVEVSLRFCYSTRGAHLELIEEVPGTVWDTSVPPGGTHVGLWSTDPAGEADRLDAAGFERVIWARDASGDVLFSYHRSPYGFLVELVHDAARALYPSWFAATESSQQGTDREFGSTTDET